MGEIAVAIADDNERILDLLGEMIENNKEMKLVGKANNGEDVYTLIKEKQPDVVLLDLIMPKMDGLSVMDTVNRDHDIRKHPSFIIITAVGQERITEDAFRKGASYYILKPFSNQKISCAGSENICTGWKCRSFGAEDKSGKSCNGYDP